MPSEASQERRRLREQDHQFRKNLDRREIGKIPPTKNPERRQSSERSLRAFCESYFPALFYLGWSPNHLKAIARIEEAAFKGGLFAIAMPRGTGKTALSIVATIWAVVHGHHRCVALIGATAPAGARLMDDVKQHLETNDRLCEDFPEVCLPIRAIQGLAIRTLGQLCNGKPTRMVWQKNTLVLPTIEGSKCSGSVLMCSGITGGSIRGCRYTTAQGELIRPSFLLADDIQSDRTAASRVQTQKLLDTLMGAVLGMAGPDKKIAGLLPCTVFRKGDAIDQILDRSKYPVWSGERTPLLRSLPVNMPLWKEYAALRAEALGIGAEPIAANEFYSSNRKAMDAGAEATWPDRFLPDELSAIQYAMNLYFRDPKTFFSEYQNQPSEEEEGVSNLTEAKLLSKVAYNKIGEVPTAHDKITAFIDVQASSLWYVVVSWGQSFSGHVVTCGVWPQQPGVVSRLSNLPRTLQTEYPGGFDAQLFAALNEGLVPFLLDTKWAREDGAELSIEKLLIDASWSESSDIVYAVCRDTRWRNIASPSRGQSVTADQAAMTEYRVRAGEKLGLNWLLKPARKNVATREVKFDTNFWKGFVCKALATPSGGAGGITLFNHATRTAGLIDHLLSEFAVRTTGRGRTVDVYKLRPDRPDNHWWDGLVGCAVGASMIGITSPTEPVRERKRISLAAKQGRR